MSSPSNLISQLIISTTSQPGPTDPVQVINNANLIQSLLIFHDELVDNLKSLLLPYLKDPKFLFPENKVGETSLGEIDINETKADSGLWVNNIVTLLSEIECKIDSSVQFVKDDWSRHLSALVKDKSSHLKQLFALATDHLKQFATADAFSDKLIALTANKSGHHEVTPEEPGDKSTDPISIYKMYIKKRRGGSMTECDENAEFPFPPSDEKTADTNNNSPNANTTSDTTEDINMLSEETQSLTSKIGPVQECSSSYNNVPGFNPNLELSTHTDDSSQGNEVNTEYTPLSIPSQLQGCSDTTSCSSQPASDSEVLRLELGPRQVTGVNTQSASASYKEIYTKEESEVYKPSKSIGFIHASSRCESDRTSTSKSSAECSLDCRIPALPSFLSSTLCQGSVNTARYCTSSVADSHGSSEGRALPQIPLFDISMLPPEDSIQPQSSSILIAYKPEKVPAESACLTFMAPFQSYLSFLPPYMLQIPQNIQAYFLYMVTEVDVRNPLNAHGMNALHVAVEMSQLEVLHFLMKFNTTNLIKQRNIRGHSPLYNSLVSESKEAFELFIKEMTTVSDCTELKSAFPDNWLLFPLPQCKSDTTNHAFLTVIKIVTSCNQCFTDTVREQLLVLYDYRKSVLQVQPLIFTFSTPDTDYCSPNNDRYPSSGGIGANKSV